MESVNLWTNCLTPSATKHCSYRGPDSHSGCSGHSSGRSRLAVLCGEEEKTNRRNLQAQRWGKFWPLQRGRTRCLTATKGGETHLRFVQNTKTDKKLQTLGVAKWRGFKLINWGRTSGSRQDGEWVFKLHSMMHKPTASFLNKHWTALGDLMEGIKNN